MKVVILAGGFGTRISEESHLKPKPMINIGDMPILWHIMKHYSSYGYNDFIICAGYKQYIIKEWFANYFVHNSDITFDFSRGNEITVHNKGKTYLENLTIRKFLNEETFMLTYGDGVSDVNISQLVEYHKKHGKLATLSAVKPDGRFGVLEIDDNNLISAFREKNKEDAGWINGGFMVLEPEIIDYIEDDTVMLERAPLEKLAEDGQLMCYKHDGFWQCMDTLRDKEKLESLWSKGVAPWKVW